MAKYYTQLPNGQIRKVIADNDEQAIEKAKELHPDAVVGHLQHALSKDAKKEIEKITQGFTKALLDD